MTDAHTASATVPTATPERYAKQLASHLGRRCEIREEPDGIRVVLADTGDCLLARGDGALEMTAIAIGPEELDRVMHVVGSHLERFGQRNELQVNWRRP